MAGGEPESRDSEKWSSHPSPSQGHPEPQGPGATVILSQEQLPGLPPIAQGHSGAAPDLPGAEGRGGETKGRKREGSSALWSTKGGKQG